MAGMIGINYSPLYKFRDQTAGSNLKLWVRSSRFFGGGPAQAEKLVEAVKAGNASAAQDHIDEGADFDCQDSNNWTPLHFAAQRGDAACCKVLLKSGCQNGMVNSNGERAMDLAEAGGHLQACAVLSSTGCLFKCPECSKLFIFSKAVGAHCLVKHRALYEDDAVREQLIADLEQSPTAVDEDVKAAAAEEVEAAFQDKEAGVMAAWLECLPGMAAAPPPQDEEADGASKKDAVVVATAPGGAAVPPAPKPLE